MLPRKLTKKKQSERWKSQAHLTHVRNHECAMCFATSPIEAAHVRLGTDGGMGRKPSDFYAVPLCKDCHQRQHSEGERTFWQAYTAARSLTVEQLIEAMCKTSPRAPDIARAKRERAMV